jgi:hypothetical protein
VIVTLSFAIPTILPAEGTIELKFAQEVRIAFRLSYFI